MIIHIQLPDGPTAGLNPNYVRTGYMYFPQSRNKVMGRFGVPIYAQLNTVRYGPEADSRYRGIDYNVLKLNQTDPGKSMSTDLVHSQTPDRAPHRDRTIAGINALFGDGSVAFQSARRLPRAFDPTVWKESLSAEDVRIIMNLWEP